MKKTSASFIILSALAFAQTPPPQAAPAAAVQPPAGRGGRGGGPAAHAPWPESEFAISSGPGLHAAGRRPQGRDQRTLHAQERGLSGYAAHLLGLRARAIRSSRARQPDGLPGRPGLQGRERRSARAERDGQPDLPPRDSGDDRRLHQSRPHGPNSRNRVRRPVGAIAPPIGGIEYNTPRRQVRPRDHRRTDARAQQGLQHFERSRAARHRRIEFRRHRRIHCRLGASQRIPQGPEQRRQLHQSSRRLCIPRARAGSRKEADSRLPV